MKKNILMLFLSLNVLNLDAQIKIGSNTKNISNNANLEVEASAGRTFVVTKDSSKVGVGTISPTHLMHIIDSVNDPVRIVGLKSGKSTDSLLTVDSLGVVKRLSSLSLGSMTEPWFNAATNTVATSNSQNIYQMGKVGIGTNNPTSNLQINSPNSDTLIRLRFTMTGVDRGFDIGISGGVNQGMSPVMKNDAWIRAGESTTSNNQNLFIGTGNTGNTASGRLGFVTNNSERMTIIQNGNVGIGITNPTWLLDVRTNSANSELVGHFVNSSQASTAESQVAIGAGIGAWAKLVGYNGTLGFRNYSTNAEFMTLKTWNGFVGIGTTNPLYPVHIKTAANTNLFLENTSGDPDGALAISIPNYNINCGGSVTCSNMISFMSGGVWIGTITPTSNGQGTQYITTSDFRLKENIKNTSFSINDLMKIKVVEYNYKLDKSKSKEIGFIAQDLNKIIPTVVTKGDEELGENGLPKKPWMVDYSRLTPMIIKATQELKNEIDKIDSLNHELKEKLNQKDIEISKLKDMIFELSQEFQTFKSAKK